MSTCFRQKLTVWQRNISFVKKKPSKWPIFVDMKLGFLTLEGPRRPSTLWHFSENSSDLVALPFHKQFIARCYLHL